jgi:YedE family putative selenium metabolism protein
MHAPFIVALLIAMAVGAFAQRSRLCMVGGLRDAMMFKDFKLLYGFVAILIVTIVGKLALGGLGWKNLTAFKLGFAEQPVAHSAHVWNFLGMALAGWGSVLLGGCPLRQLILAGEGNGDSAVAVFGMIAGAAISHNFGLAGAAGKPAAEAVSLNAKVVILCGFVILLIISLLNLPKEKKA